MKKQLCITVCFYCLGMCLNNSSLWCSRTHWNLHTKDNFQTHNCEEREASMTQDERTGQQAKRRLLSETFRWDGRTEGSPWLPRFFSFFDWKHQVLRGVQVKATDITNIAVSQDKGEKGCHKRKKAGIQIDWQAGASPGTTFENPEVLQEKRENLFHPIWNAAALICFDSVSWFLNFALL